ncbi:DUF6998 domain-containing protein [Enterococcus sp. LJL120]
MMTPEDIRESLKENIEFLKKELKRGAPLGELRHLTGRIGELYVANKYNGEMAIYTNQSGFDVKAPDGKRISVKTTSSTNGSHQFFFNKNTLDEVDHVVILRISDTANITTLFDASVKDARKLMVERGKYAISQSKLSNQKKYLSEGSGFEKELVVSTNVDLASMDYYEFSIDGTLYGMFKNNNLIRLQKNLKLVKSVKPELRNMCFLLRIPVTYSGSGGDAITNRLYSSKILKKLGLTDTKDIEFRNYVFALDGTVFALYYENNNENRVRLIENGTKVSAVKPKLIEISSYLDLDIYRSDDNKYTNKQYAKKILHKLNLE